MKLTISSLLLTLCLLTCTANSVEVTTGNILNNSTFGIGTQYSDTGWDVTGYDNHHDNLGSGTVNNTPGGSFAAGVDSEISQSVTLSTDAEMNQKEIQNGFSSTLGADIWFWNNHNNTITLEQKVTGADGSVTTQTRNIATSNCGFSNCNQYNNYTDTYVQGTNTQTDFDIKVTIKNVGVGYTSGHLGPDIDDVTLSVTYTDIDLIDQDATDAIDDIEENIPDIPEDIFEEEFFFEEEYFTWEEDFYFDDSFTMEEEFSVYEMPEEFEIIEMPEEFEEMVMEMPDDMPMEMPTDMEDAFTIMEEEMPEMEMTEEPTEMEMEEEFVEMEIEDDRPTMEEVKEEPEEMEVAEEETIDMEMETEEDNMEMPSEEAEEMEVAENEDTMEEPEKDEEPEESSNEELEEESEPEESLSETAANEEDAVGETTVTDEGGITTKNIEVSKNIKIKNVDVGEIKVSVNPKDIFKEVVSLDSYSNKDFYKDNGLQYDVNDDFFNQLSMIEYSKEIYKGITLITYIQGDPVEMYRQELEELAIQKAGIMIELKLLRGE